ncbi:MAG TPA: ABC transporter substrate-binding protein, partial [Thermoanaerobaculia bacterium]|nr:ABC transporter substrate-binding protein [Thermoanaerobaculia bacterium]
FEPLLRYDRKMSFSPALAARWDIADGRTWRFHLRDGAKFQDGSLVTAEDAAFSIERARTKKESDLYPYLAGISAVKALDPMTVEVVSDRPAGLLSILTFVYVFPKKRFLAEGEAAFFKKPVGSGPYRLVEWVPKDRFVLQRWTGWWAGLPAVPRVVFHHAPNPDALWKLAEKQPSVLLLSPSRLGVKEHESDPRYRIQQRPGMTVQYLMCNLRGGAKNPLTSLKVRQALRAAIDYPKLVESVSHGAAFAASQYVTPDVIGFNPALTVPVFEPGLAKKLLAEAGHAGGVTFTMNVLNDQARLDVEVARQLEDAGIHVKMIPADRTAFYDRVNSCEGDLHATGWVCSTGDASELFEGNFYGRKGAGGPPGCGYSRPDLDELVDRIAQTLDAEARRNLLQDAMKRVLDDLPWIPLLVGSDRYALSPEVAFEPRADGEVFLPDVSFK